MRYPDSEEMRSGESRTREKFGLNSDTVRVVLHSPQERRDRVRAASVVRAVRWAGRVSCESHTIESR